MYIDTHCHISKNDFEDINKVIENIQNNYAIISGADYNLNKEVVDLINKYDNLYGTIGIHPSEIHNNINEALDFIEKNIDNPKIVGLGEIGLDYYYGKEDKEEQKYYFEKQIEIAVRHNKPIVIHSRDAAQDTFEIIEKYKDLKKTMHCYSYSKEMAEKFKKINVKFGIGGIVTFKNSKNIKEVVELLDIEDILLETDSPYLAPEPIRGTKNEPKNVLIIAQKIAEIKNKSVSEVLDCTTKNAIVQFDLKI